MSDDEWSDEDVRNKEPTAKVIGTYRVKEDYLPPTHKHLTLIQDDLVYVFRKGGADLPADFWEGETKGVMGIFPSKYVEVAKTLDQEIAESTKKK